MTDGIAQIKSSRPKWTDDAADAGNYYDTENDGPMTTAEAVLVVAMAGSSSLLMVWAAWVVGGWIF